MNKTRYAGMTLAWLVMAAAAVICLPGSPASATEEATIMAGTLDIFASDSTLYSTQDLGETGSTECTEGSGTLTVSSTNAFSASFSSDTSTVIGGTTYHMLLNMSLSGTISTTGVITSGTGSATATLYANSSCASTGTPCSLVVSGITFSGTSDVTNHVVEASDTATVSGTTGDHGAFTFNVSVTGSCGGLSAVDDGSFVFANAQVQAGRPIKVTWVGQDDDAKLAKCDFVFIQGGQVGFKDDVLHNTPFTWNAPGAGSYSVRVTRCDKPGAGGGGTFRVEGGTTCSGAPGETLVGHSPLPRSVTTTVPRKGSVCTFKIRQTSP